MEREKFLALVQKALEDLPRKFKDKLENIDVVVESEPTREQSGAVGSKDRRTLLGLYQGVPRSRRGHHYGMVMPDKVSIFQKNIERICKTDEEVVHRVTHTVRHELAHHFGISDERLRDLGLY